MDPTYQQGLITQLMGGAGAGGMSDAFSASPNFINPQYATPTQIQSLRDYSNALMKNQQFVHRPIQGISNMVNALLGGNASYQANIASQAQQAALQNSYAKGAATSLGNGIGPAGSPAPAPTQTSSGGAATGPAPSDVQSYIAQSAAARGIDPTTATKVFGAESGFNPSATGDNGTSGGVAQLHVGGGLGDEYRQVDPGFDPKNPSANWQNQVDFALDKAKQGGWSPWHAAENVGVGPMDGINGAPPAGASANPYIPALANTGGAPPQSPQYKQMMIQALHGGGGAFTPADAAYLAVGPAATPESRALATSIVNPSMVEDSIGNKYFQRPNHISPPVIAGLKIEHATLGDQNVPVGINGNPGNPNVNVLAPNAGASPSPSNGQAPVGAGGPLGGFAPLVAAGQAIKAQGAAKEAVGQAAGAQLAQDRQNASNYYRTVFPLQHAIPALEALGSTGTGPGTEQLNEIKSFLQSAGIPGVDASTIQDFDEAKKYLTDYVNQSGAGGTNDKLAAAFAGNPNVHISNAAAVDVAKSALALQRMQQAKVMGFSNQPESQYPNYATQFASSQDPRAYGIDLMTPAAREKLNASLPSGSPERARFLQSLATAKRTGVLQPVGAN